MGAFKDFVTGIANAKILPNDLDIENLDKPVEIKVYRKENGTAEKNIGTYVGILETFWSNDDAVGIKLKGRGEIVTTWTDHHIEVRVRR